MSISLQGHPPEESFERYSLGTLSAEEAEPFECHLLLCPACQDRLEAADSYIATMRAAAREVRAGERAPREWFGWMRAPAWRFAAAAVALLLVALVWQYPHGGQTAPATVMLAAYRGDAPLAQATAPAGTPLNLMVEPEGLPPLSSYELEVVDSRGVPVVQRQPQPARNPVSFSVPALKRDRYWVRVYGAPPQRELLREFALNVR